MADHFVLIAPCYNEEKSITQFLDQLAVVLGGISADFTVIMVDDASADTTPEILEQYHFSIDNVTLKVIRLEFNAGHQRAIAQGLHYARNFDAKGYIVMDADGEDNPEAIPELSSMSDFEIVFVSRGKRKENLKFLIGYYCYKIFFKTVIGKSINFGNYSMINKRVLDTVVKQNYNHYSAFLSKQKFNRQFIRYDRNIRLGGSSKMKYNHLVFHGLNSLIEYSEELLGFLLKVYLIMILGLIGLGGVVVYKKFVSHEAILGWTSTLGISLFNSSLIIISSIFISLLIISNKRAATGRQNIYEIIK